VKEREGRRNRYTIQHHLPLPEQSSRERTIGDVLDVLVDTTGAARQGAPGSRRTRATVKRRVVRR
jgi:hypothetical protein